MTKRTVAIMQPTYLPYLGYFELMAQADAFVLLDDVQFERSSWQARNRVLAASGEVMLTVPVKRTGLDSLIGEVEIADDRAWRRKHLATIQQAYGVRPHGPAAISLMRGALDRDPARLADLTGGLIREAASNLGVTAEVVWSSDLGCAGKRSDHLLAICRKLDATDYLSTAGSRDYLEADGVLAAAGLPIRYHSFAPKPYDQGRATFTPYMGFIDAVANLGWDGTSALLGRG